MNIGGSPTIAERLDYLKVCEAAISAYDSLHDSALSNAGHCGGKNLLSEKAAFIQQAAEYDNLKIHYRNLKVAIAMDLCKDPRFVKYTENMDVPLELGNVNKNPQVMQTIGQPMPTSQTVQIDDNPSFGGR